MRFRFIKIICLSWFIVVILHGVIFRGIGGGISALYAQQIADILPQSQKFEGAFQSQIQEAKRLLKLQQWDAVIKLLEKNTWLGSDAEIFGILGHAYYAKSVLRQDRDTPLRALRRYIHKRKAINNFSKASEIDPDNLDWPYGLAILYLSVSDENDLQKATDLLLEIQSQNKEFRNVPFLLGLVYRKLNDFEKSQTTFEEFLKSKPDPIAMLELAFIHTQKNELREAEQYYLKALDNLKSKDAVKRVMEEVEFLLSPQEKVSLRQEEDRGKWLKRFWIEKDPTPRTPENERLQEHLSRVVYAQNNFASPGARARFDARGMVYIKYGLPSYRYQDGGNSGIYQNESWTYDWALADNKDGLIFEFANEPGYGFRLIRDLRDIFVTSYSVKELIYVYQEREDVNGAYYGMLAHSLDAIDFTEKFRNMRDKKSRAYRKAPSQVFIYKDFPEKKLPVYLEDATFRGENGATRHEVYYGFPLANIHFTKEEQYHHTSLIREVTIRNTEAEELFHNQVLMDLTISRSENVSDKVYIGQVNFDLIPQGESPILHFSLNDPSDKRMGLYSYTLKERDYSGNGLLVSDIKFSGRIIPSREEDDFTRKGLHVEPLLTSALNSKRPVQIYFEIYNLFQDQNGDAKCRIQYSVERETSPQERRLQFFDVWGEMVNPAARPDKDYISLSNEVTVNNSEYADYTTIEMGAFNDGRYRFVVTVTDLNTLKTADSHRSLILYGH